MANKKNSGYAVGIDLGTTYSSVAVWREEYQRVEIIPNERSKRTTPSFVAFNNGRCFIGDAALYQANHNPPNTIYDVKRLIGRKYNDPTIQDDMKKWPFKVIADEKDNPMIVVNKDNKGKKKIYRPEQILAKILKKMCEYAETHLQSPVKDVVITVPAYFNDSQRQATKDAGAIAGLNVVRIINEPSAAALAYGVEKRAISVDQDRNIFIFDLGGGSFDVSLINVKDGVYQVKAKAGNNHLGGEDFVNKMMTHFMEEFKRKSNVDMSGDAKALWKLRTACEKAKKVLSVNDEAAIEIDPLFQGIEFCSEITRDQFEELNKEFFQECMEIVERCFKDAEMDKSSVHEVVLVGGSSRIPKLQKLLRDFFNGKKLYESINLDESVAYGAAIQAAILSESYTKIPISVLLDATPLSLGIGIHRGVVDVLIPRNTLFPVKKTRQYYCAIQDNHTSVVLKIYECEDNNFLGSFELTGLPPPARRGHFVTVCFEIDADGILLVSNNEGKTAGQKKKIVMDKRSRLSDQEITRLIQEGRVDEEEEKKFLEKAIAISDLDKYVCIMETTLNDENISANFSSQDRENINSAIDKGRELVEGDNDNEQQEQDIEAVKDCLKEVKSMCESIIKCKIG